MIKAQLSKEYAGTAKVLVQSDVWWAEQKIDGQRLLLKVDNNKVSAFNRQGDQMGFDNPEILLALSGGFTGQWIFDGEYLNDHYYVFDLLQTKTKDMTVRSFSERREMLEKLFLLIDCSEMTLLPVAKTEEQKISLLIETKLNGYEGLMFKRHGDTYRPGADNQWWKVKHYNTLDAVVMELNRGEKEQAITIGLYKEGHLVEVGGCKVSTYHMKSLSEGDVVEIRYLYATEADHVYIPIFSRIRLDKPAESCYTTQLQYATKQVIKEIA